MSLKKNISSFSLLFFAISSIIGSGWLFGAYYTAKIAGVASILSWVIGCALVAIIALTLAEVSTAFPVSGGSANYAYVSHGEFSGFVYGFITWLWPTLVVPLEVQAVLQYASSYIPNIVIPENSQLTSLGLLMALGLMIILNLANLLAIKTVSSLNNFITFWKIVIPLVICYMLFTQNPHYANLYHEGSFLTYGWKGVFEGIVMGGVCLSFIGFQTAIFLAGETKNPQKAIPFALLGSLSICLIIYLLLQVGFIVSLNPTHLANGWKEINFEGATGPFAGIFISLGILWILKVLYFDAIFSPLGTANNFVTNASRILYSLAAQKKLPTVIAKTNKFSSPYVAIFINFLIGMLFFLPFRGWQSMMSFLTAAIVFTLSIVPLCLPIFREMFPNQVRTIKFKHYKLISFSAFYICNLLMHWSGWDTIAKLDLVIIISSSFYMFHNPKLLAAKWKDLKNSAWLILYLTFITICAAISVYGNGYGLISPSLDFILVFLYSLLIYFMALKFRLKHHSVLKEKTA